MYKKFISQSHEKLLSLVLYYIFRKFQEVLENAYTEKVSKIFHKVSENIYIVKNYWQEKIKCYNIIIRKEVLTW